MIVGELGDLEVILERVLAEYGDALERLALPATLDDDAAPMPPVIEDRSEKPHSRI